MLYFHDSSTPSLTPNIYPSNMSGRGAGKSGPAYGRGKGLSKPDQQRRRNLAPSEHQLLAEAFRKPAIRRMIRRGGGKRIASNIYAESRVIAGKFLHEMVRITLGYTSNSKR